MKYFRIAVLVMVVLVVAGCQTKTALVYGEGDTTAQAVRSALNAMNTASQSGYSAISVGGGAGFGIGGEGLTKRHANVYILLEGPPSAPEIIPATGAPVP